MFFSKKEEGRSAQPDSIDPSFPMLYVWPSLLFHPAGGYEPDRRECVCYVQGFTAFQPIVHDFRSAVAFVILPFNFIKLCTVYALGIPLALKLFRLVVRREPGR
ncbi:hypothetical protein [Halobacillus litoralis]|uniref:hypothetical protein n=1 Tax=Halobacillus litoralis TaxID=45668 RepID=UPI001CD70D44|nr:hypothetical protein [Halobacillus litoralis]MCA1022424.1 hypothetical protein [Halobacillus litoralis]